MPDHICVLPQLTRQFRHLFVVNAWPEAVHHMPSRLPCTMLTACQCLLLTLAGPDHPQLTSRFWLPAAAVYHDCLRSVRIDRNGAHGLAHKPRHSITTASVTVAHGYTTALHSAPRPRGYLNVAP